MNKIVIHIDGGVLQSVIADHPVLVSVIDLDSDGDDRSVRVKMRNGYEVDAFVAQYRASVRKKKVDYYTKEVWRHIKARKV